MNFPDFDFQLQQKSSILCMSLFQQNFSNFTNLNLPVFHLDAKRRRGPGQKHLRAAGGGAHCGDQQQLHDAIRASAEGGQHLVVPTVVFAVGRLDGEMIVG